MMWSKAPWGNIKLTIIQPVFKIYSHQLRGIEESPIKHLLLLFFLPGGKQSIYLPLPWLENCNFKTKQNKTHTHTHTHIFLCPQSRNIARKSQSISYDLLGNCIWLSQIYGSSSVAHQQRICLQCRNHRRHGFDPWVGKIPWRRAQQPTPVFLPEESP